MRVLPLRWRAHRGQHVGRAIHAGIGLGRDIGPVRLDVGQMQAPRSPVGFGFRDEIHRAAGHVGRLGVLVRDARGLVGMNQKPAVLQASVGVRAGIGPMLPGIFRLIAVLAQVSIIARARPAGRMQAVVALVRLEAALRDMNADDRIRRDAEHLHAFEVGGHVGLADQHVAHADLLQVIAERRLADAQRPAVPVRAVRAHVAPGIEGHARGAADRRLHIGVGEAHPALCHRVDIRGLQRGVAGAAEIIMAKLVAHDPDDVFRARHARDFSDLDFGDFGTRDAATSNAR